MTIIFEDGSLDCTSIIARAGNDLSARDIGPSRNFGHSIAIHAGVEAASG